MDIQNYRILDIDPGLRPYAEDISMRMRNYIRTKSVLLSGTQSIAEFANAYLYYGFHQSENCWYYREWAPGAKSIHLFGDFNHWNRTSHSMYQVSDGVWEIAGKGKLPHASKVRILIHTGTEVLERIPAYCRRAVQNPDTLSFDGQIWEPENSFPWKDHDFHGNQKEPVLIYECHIGISGEEEKIGNFREFTEKVLPRVRALGYNTIQLMGIMEHPYYGSFGYQVSNFYAVSSRFGTPEELMCLIDTAHRMGISVLLDIVHSHAVRNEVEGLNRFDGTDYQYFHAGEKGNHPQWGTKLFDYGKPEVLHFLLSNLKFWLEEYHFDGFRFDGVTSMIYQDHGVGEVFGNYRQYFSMNTCTEAVTYLQLAAELCKAVKSDCILIAEDMSGMPGMCLPVRDGGIGFDYRLGMGVPDFWIQTLRNVRDEDWNMGRLWHELTQRRPQEKVIGYCESHDQAFVGDKTIMFWLADKEMYWHMGKASQNSAIERAVALHKMIRLITCLCAGEGYLNFMGNEFGHPEWIDFPREGNGFSYHYARRLWSLAEDDSLLYCCLRSFDQAMITLVKDTGILQATSVLFRIIEDSKVILFRKDHFLCVFNFHPERDFNVELPLNAKAMQLVLDTNDEKYGGWKKPENRRMTAESGKFTLNIEKRGGMVWELTFF